MDLPRIPKDAQRRSRRNALLALLGAACASPALGARHDAPFQAAVASYRSGRYSEAFGRMIRLASSGDADAARIALFMHQYGPLLYGAYWDLSHDEIAVFEESAVHARLRQQPAYRPDPRPLPTKLRR